MDFDDGINGNFELDSAYKFTLNAQVINVNQLTWSSPPAAAQPGWFSTWSYNHEAGSWDPPPPMTGVDQGELQRQASRSFWSGILFGFAGGALISLIQVLLMEHWGRKKPAP